MTARRHQSGFALLLFMVVLIGFVTAGASKFLSSSVIQQNDQVRKKTQTALIKAKQALLSYAVDYRAEDKGPGGGPDGNVDFYRMGRLPCPDASAAGTEGNQDPGCGALGVNSVGYLPFKSIGLGKIEDGNGQCLWYIVSGDYKNSPSAEALNRDSVGYLNVVDENGNLRHGTDESDFPIALIISPGAAMTGQSHTPEVDGTLDGCQANRTLTNYLEAGGLIDYSTDLPTTADTLWAFLDTTESASLNNQAHNDQIIAIYRDELWPRVAAMNDLSFDNAAGVAPLSPIENLTRAMAECLATYGNAQANRRLPHPAPLVMADYRLDANYDDDSALRFGRLPQVIDFGPSNQANFIFDAAANSYCEGATATAYDEYLWQNWKDHFFYAVSEDFDAVNVVPATFIKCTGAGGSSGCIQVDTKPDSIAAMVLYAGPVEGGQSRVWWWDEASTSVTVDDKQDPANYLEGDAQAGYAAGFNNFDLTATITDYAYCVGYDNTTFQLSAIKCADL